MTYRSRGAAFHIKVENPDGVCRGVRRVEVDGVEKPDKLIPLEGVRGVHEVRVIMGAT